MLESRFGKVLIITYTLFAIIVYAMAFSCGLDSCGHYIVLPVMPWAYILVEDFGIGFPWAVYPIMALLNISVAYVIGVGIEWLYDRYTERNR